VQTERGGEGLSRTLWESGGSPFKTAAFNHSATTPWGPNFLAGSKLRKPVKFVGHARALLANLSPIRAAMTRSVRRLVR
jgi:hypothetical protein